MSASPRVFPTTPVMGRGTEPMDKRLKYQLSQTNHSQITQSTTRQTSRVTSSSVWKSVTSHIGLFIILLLYTFAGAAMMYEIEGYEPNRKTMINEYESLYTNITQGYSIDDFTQLFVNVTFQSQKDSNAVTLTADELNNLLNEYRIRKDENKRIAKLKSQDYWQWFLFCCSVYTTVGYGTIVPITQIGRICCMLYATIGIPLFLTTMTKIGKLFARLLKHSWSLVRKLQKKLCNCMKRRQKKKKEAIQETEMKTKALKTNMNQSVDETDLERDKKDDDFNVNPLVAIALMILYILLGAVMYKQWETDWSYNEAFYFIFISLSTIGFGDIIPSHPRFFLLSSSYIFIGLAIVAMVINVLIDFFKDTMETVREHVPEILLNPSQLIGGSDSESDESDRGDKMA